MLPQTQVKSIQKLLSIKNEKNAVFFLSRLKNWIEKNGNTTISIAKGINKILNDIHQKEIKQNQDLKAIKLPNNPLIKKYYKEILELNKKGLGARKIEKELWLNHRAKISYSTIYRFLKANK